MERARVKRRTVLDEAPSDVWLRIVDAFPAWFGAGATLEPWLGGRVACDGRAGHVTRCERATGIEWEWGRDGDPGWSDVTISLRAQEGRTLVEVTETLHEWEHEVHEAIAAEPGARDRRLLGIG